MASLTAQAEIVVENIGGNLHVNQVVNSKLVRRVILGLRRESAMDSGMARAVCF
jgi:hypothetical protein